MKHPLRPRPVYKDPTGRIPDEVMYGFMEGFNDEYQNVAAIKQYLLTEEQRKWLYDNRLDIADVLSGRTDETHEDEVNKMFADWNSKLGKMPNGEDVFGA